MSDEQPTQQFHLQVETQLETLKEILLWYEQNIQPLLAEPTSWQCQLALVEGFTNAVRHAHQNLPDNTPIELEVNLFPSHLEMKVLDRGKNFDLEAELRTQSRLHDTGNSQAEFLSEGGRGLLWIEQLTDELRYIRLPDKRNCLVMVKKIS